MDSGYSGGKVSVGEFLLKILIFLSNYLVYLLIKYEQKKKRFFNDSQFIYFGFALLVSHIRATKNANIFSQKDLKY